MPIRSTLFQIPGQRGASVPSHVTLEDGKAVTVVAAAKDVIQKKELPKDRLSLDDWHSSNNNNRLHSIKNIAIYYLTFFSSEGLGELGSKATD